MTARTAPLYESGDQVTVSSVDENGFQGRDPHPEPELVGQTGTIVGLVDSYLVDHDPAFLLHFYAVLFQNGSVRIMVEYELS